jgi:hypothetical protein
MAQALAPATNAMPGALDITVYRKLRAAVAAALADAARAALTFPCRTIIAVARAANLKDTAVVGELPAPRQAARYLRARVYNPRPLSFLQAARIPTAS